MVYTPRGAPRGQRQTSSDQFPASVRTIADIALDDGGKFFWHADPIIWSDSRIQQMDLLTMVCGFWKMAKFAPDRKVLNRNKALMLTALLFEHAQNGYPMRGKLPQQIVAECYEDLHSYYYYPWSGPWGLLGCWGP